jgi:predicted Zn-dependent protease
LQEYWLKRTVGLVLGLLALLGGCVGTRASLQTSIAGSSLSPSVEGSRIYFVPLGDFSPAQLDSMVQFYRQRYGLDISVLKTVPLDDSARDSSRQQVIAEKLLANLRRAAPNLANDGKAVLIGFTSEDIYPASQNWPFCFSWRDANAHTAVVSTARLNLHRDSAPFAADISATRLRKVLTKDIGVLYYGLPQNANSKSVMYQFVVGTDDLDQVSEEF